MGVVEGTIGSVRDGDGEVVGSVGGEVGCGVVQGI